MKNYLIVGAGFSGILAAISLKINNPKASVIVLEHTDKALKKVLSTGNGKCNLANAKLDLNKFKNSDFVKKIYKTPQLSKQQDFFRNLGIETKLMDNLLYPTSESAVTVRNALLKQCDKLGIQINLNESIIEYKPKDKINVKTTKAKYEVDKLIFACGGKSLPVSGSDGSIFPLLEKHGYHIIKPTPSLCPIKKKEKTKTLSGTRVKANVNLYRNHNIVFSESGEILFKDHGLSGIVIMNLSRQIAQEKDKYTIELDLLENYKDKHIATYITKYGEKEFLEAFLHPNIVKYFCENKINPLFAKRLTFTFKSLSDFEFSQVTAGGISIDDVNLNLESKKEKNVFFVGEILDIDGPCGGYNLTWAYVSSMLMK